MSALELVSALVLGTGVFFVAIGAIGFIRLPDVFCRLHVTGVVDTLGAPMIMLGVAIHLGAQLVSIKLLMGIAFLAITSPLLGHLLARAALEAGHKPQQLEEDTGAHRIDGGKGQAES
jgi:multicomponent Na+:H+ antiporter subunit G